MTEEKNSTNATDDTAHGSTAQQETTFTQADVDRIVSERLARVKGTQLPESDIKAFRNWQENQKTEAEKQKEREKEYISTKRENAQLKAEKKLISKNTKPEFTEFVATKLLNMDGDFDSNLEQFKKDNPQYFGEIAIKRLSTSANLSGSTGSDEITAHQRMNNILRNRGN